MPRVAIPVWVRPDAARVPSWVLVAIVLAPSVEPAGLAEAFVVAGLVAVELVAEVAQAEAVVPAVPAHGVSELSAVV